MHTGQRLSVIRTAGACFALAAAFFVMDPAATAQVLTPIPVYDVNAMTPDEIVGRDQLTDEERQYYDTLKDPVAAQAFLMTRSYVRVCQRIVDHTLPATQLPPKPPGFSVAYLLPDDPHIINDAEGEYLKIALARHIQQ